jgi:catechol 2,3-dioxygenase-like lactoylglutathione lyase family enzyme
MIGELQQSATCCPLRHTKNNGATGGLACILNLKDSSSQHSTWMTWRLRPAFTRGSLDSRLSNLGERGCALQAGERQVLLLFKKGGSRLTTSPHDGDGELHIAFAVSAAELPNWELWLEENGIDVEERRTWDLGGQSVYFRDPDRHLLEIATPGVWSVY